MRLLNSSKLNKVFISLLISTVLFLLSSCTSNNFSKQDIVIYGDSRSDHDAHQKVVNAIVKCSPSFVFHTGDLVADGTNPDLWPIFNNIVEELVKIAEFYPALGNHENNSQLYFDNFDLPNNERWYSVDVDNIHFVILDSNYDINIGSEQYNWLESDLNNISDNIDFIIAIFHHPLFGSGRHGSNVSLRDILVPLFELYGVDIVFNGHDHTYERSLYHNIYYIVTGGGGAPLHDQENINPYSQVFVKTYHFCGININEDRLSVSVFKPNSTIIDTFTILGSKTP